VTHRCPNRTFLLKFARDRDACRSTLRKQLRHFDVAILDYCATSNHVHLLTDSDQRSELSGFMQGVQKDPLPCESCRLQSASASSASHVSV
jgi:putative transposase